MNDHVCDRCEEAPATTTNHTARVGTADQVHSCHLCDRCQRIVFELNRGRVLWELEGIVNRHAVKAFRAAQDVEQEEKARVWHAELDARVIRSWAARFGATMGDKRAA